jgi:hypothetical protein
MPINNYKSLWDSHFSASGFIRPIWFLFGIISFRASINYCMSLYLERFCSKFEFYFSENILVKDIFLSFTDLLATLTHKQDICIG